MSILLVCVFFLLLFAAALWPLLFSRVPWKNWIFAGSNIISLIFLLSLGSGIAKNREKIKERKEDFRTALILASEILDSGKTPPPGFRITGINAPAVNPEIFRQLDSFRADVQTLYNITRAAAGKKDAGK